MFYLRVGNIFASFLALTPLFLDQFRQTKILRTHKIMLFPVICGFLPRSERKWGLSRANTTPRDKRGVNNIKKMDFSSAPVRGVGRRGRIRIQVGICFRPQLQGGDKAALSKDSRNKIENLRMSDQLFEHFIA